MSVLSAPVTDRLSDNITIYCVYIMDYYKLYTNNIKNTYKNRYFYNKEGMNI